MRKSPYHIRAGSADDSANLRPTVTPRPSKSVPGTSRIPSPTRKVPPTKPSRTLSPDARPSSISPSRAGTFSPGKYSDDRKSQSLEFGSGDPGSGRNLVRYITHDMIKRIAKEDQMEHIRSLNFNLAGEKKIRYIENLEEVKNLTSLSFSGNVITKIEKIEHLVKLRDLNFANNRISKIEGIDTLYNLQSLNLSGNHIEVIPLATVKKLKSLRTLKLANNSISSLAEIVKLRNLQDLHSLTIGNNPLCEVPHYRQYIVFHLRSLEQLDGQVITINERSVAQTRFSQEELDRVTRELQTAKEELKESREQHNASMEDLNDYTIREKEYEERDFTAVQARTELEREVNVKDDLLKKKAKELQKAQARQYQLEQELAFYKLDAKFEPFTLPADEIVSDDDSPYIGKSPYKRDQLTGKAHVGSPAKRQAQGIDLEEKKRLEKELADREKLLKRAGDQLNALEKELQETQQQLVEANEEKDRLRKENMQHSLTEAQRKKLREKLAAKIHKVEMLHAQVEQLEDAIATKQDDIQNRKKEIDKMNEKLKTHDPKSPEYARLKREIEEKEKELQDAETELNDMENKLTKLLKQIAVETEAIKQIEEQLQKDDEEDSLRNELEEIIAGLQDYLANVRRKANAQRAQVESLMRDKERLKHHLNNLEDENNRMMQDTEDYSELQEQVGVLGELNDLLQATQDLSESIIHSVPATPSADRKQSFPALTDKPDAHAIVKTLNDLNKSLTEMKGVNAALQDESRNAQTDADNLRRQLENAENKIKKLQKAGNDYRGKLGHQMEETARLQNVAGDKEAEAKSLKKELNNTKEKLTQAMENMLTPEQVRDRIAKLQDQLKRGDHSSVKDDDEIGQALNELQKVLLDLLRREAEERENAEKRLNELEEKMKQHKDKLLQAQQEYKETMEAAADAKLDAEKNRREKDVQRLQDEVNDLKKQLKDADSIEERAKMRDESAQAIIRDLERELDEAQRKCRDKDRQNAFHEDELEDLRNTLKNMQAEQGKDLRAAINAETAADRARQDLQRADDEIKLLRDILREREGRPGDRELLHQAHASLGQKEDDVRRLRRLLNNLKADSSDEINGLLAEIDALRNALCRQGTQFKTMWPAGYYCMAGPPSGGKWIYSPGKSKNYSSGSFICAPQEQLQPGTPGMIVLQEDGSYVLVPFEGYYCNVPDHHDMEDKLNRLNDKKSKRDEKMEEEADELEELIENHRITLRKLKEDEERMAHEKEVTAQELSSLKSTLTRNLNKKNTLESQVTQLLGEMKMEEALAQYDSMQEELDALEQSLNKRHMELRETEKMMVLNRNKSNEAQKKVGILTERYNELQAHYNNSEQDCVELERRARDTSMQLVRATKELRQMEAHVKKNEARKIALQDECQQLTRLMGDKESEYSALQQKTEHMTNNLEQLQSELLLAEEKQSERLSTLRDSEKILMERKNELNRVKEDADMQRDEVEALDRMMGKRKTELQLLQDSIEQHQNELASVLRDGQTDVQEKQKQIKELKKSVEELSLCRSDLEAQVQTRREDLAKIRENIDAATEELQNSSSEIIKQKSELKHVLEMLRLEQTELENLRMQHETKISELDKTQRHLLDERTELDRLQTETQRKSVELERNKQMVEKLRNDIDHLTTERTSLTDTVNSLVKEKEFLTDSCSGLDEKLQSSKQGMLEAKLGVDKAKTMLEQLDREVNQARREVEDTNDEKTSLTREVATLRNTSRDLKSDVNMYRNELKEAEEKLRIFEQDLREHTKKRDDIMLQLTSVQEEIHYASQQKESVNQSLRQKQTNLENLNRSLKEKEVLLDDKQKSLQSITKEIEREQGRCSRILQQLSTEASKQQSDLNEKKEEMEEVIAKKEAMKREMQRLGHFEDKFQDMSAEVETLRNELASIEEKFHDSERNNSELKGRLSTAEGEISALTIEHEHEKQKLTDKLTEMEDSLRRQRERDSAEITSLENAAQDHCTRATRLSNELNDLRMQYIALKKQLRLQEEESDLKQLEMERAMNHLKSETKNETKVEKEEDDENSRIKVPGDGWNLYAKREFPEIKCKPLRERNYTPPSKLSVPTVEPGPSINLLREELAAQQEKIASQIRCQMSRHREAWEERKRQSEGKLSQLRKKVDNLDDLVNNSMTRSYRLDSIPGSDDTFLDLPYKNHDETIQPFRS